MNLIEQLEQEEMARLGKTVPEFGPGDTVVVQVKVKDEPVSVCRLTKASLSPSVTAASIPVLSCARFRPARASNGPSRPGRRWSPPLK